MNIKIISTGLLFLILALVVVPGVSAYASLKGTGDHPHPVTATQAATCKACHIENGAPLDLQTCSRCHVDPYPPTANATATPAVTATSAVTPTPTVTAAPAATKAPTTPGFSIVSTIVGLFAFFMVKRNNK